MGVPPKMAYTWRPPEKGTIFRLQVNVRVKISSVEVYERIGKSVISLFEKKNREGRKDEFYNCEKV